MSMAVARKHLVIGLCSLIVLTVGGGLIARRLLTAPTSSRIPDGARSQDARPQAIASGLTVPWEIVELPDRDLLVTERSGTLRRLGKDNKSYEIAGVQHTSEGGLLGLALHPRFAENHYLYLYLTSRTNDGLTNRVERYKYENDRLQDKSTILADIPGAANHDGGRIAFGPDGLLYVTTGDAGNEPAAQDMKSLAGKILRVKDDGSVPADNPFDNAVYSYGHRNPQGLAWDDSGQLWSTEHGRSGVRSGFDELNRIKRGGNYGWPVIEGDESREGMERPVLHSGAGDTWAPASLAFWRGSFVFGGLRGESLYQVTTKPDGGMALRAHFRGEFGRLRSVSSGRDEVLYFSTSNTDGRGSADSGDDKVLSIRQL